MEALSKCRTFPKFPELPTELCCSIWEHAYLAAQPRITNIFSIIDQNSGKLLHKERQRHVKHLILSCLEARDVGYKNIQVWTRGCRQVHVYFNARIETLWFSGLSLRHKNLSIGLCQERIISLAFALESWTTSQMEILKSILLGFPNLQHLSFVIPSYFGPPNHSSNLALVPSPPPAAALIKGRTLSDTLKLKAEEITWERVQDAIKSDLELPSVTVEIISLVPVEQEEHWRIHHNHQSMNIADRLSSMRAMIELRNGRCLACSRSEEESKENQEDRDDKVLYIETLQEVLSRICKVLRFSDAF